MKRRHYYILSKQLLPVVNPCCFLLTCSQVGGVLSVRQTQSSVPEVLQAGAGGEEAGRLRRPLHHQWVSVSTFLYLLQRFETTTAEAAFMSFLCWNVNILVGLKGSQIELNHLGVFRNFAFWYHLKPFNFCFKGRDCALQ